MCETIEKIALLSVYFLVFYESKKIFEKDLVFYKKCDILTNKGSRLVPTF
jgi:hypothetical protein